MATKANCLLRVLSDPRSHLTGLTIELLSVAQGEKCDLCLQSSLGTSDTVLVCPRPITS